MNSSAAAAAGASSVYGSSAAGTAGPGGCSTTTVVTENSVTSSHMLRIECFWATKGVGFGKFIKSSPFIVGGHTWAIRYYPDGRDYSDNSWMSVDVCLDRPASTGDVVRAQFKFSLLDYQGNPIQPYSNFCRGPTKSFSAGGSQPWTCHKVVKRKRGLENYIDLWDNCLRIKCDLTVVGFGVHTEGAEQKRRRITVPPQNLFQDLFDLLRTAKGADVVFEVGGELFTAHRNVLAARSSVFDAEFFGPMKEKTGTHIRIEDMEPKVFGLLLRFVYTDSLPAMTEGEETIVMAQHLLVAADRYDLKRLKLICEDKLCDGIDIGTVATTMALAEQHSCHGLREACIDFLSSPGNLKKVMATDGYHHLRDSCPSFLEELIDKFTTT